MIKSGQSVSPENCCLEDDSCPYKMVQNFKKHLSFPWCEVFCFRGFLLDFVFQEQLQAAMQLSLEASMAAPVPEELGENGWRLKAPKTP